mmetsp:Transcript_16557/g.23356  ORF Transcript_16557/g.23356 Transcript_16557/m.23356 type:complete len:309 (-) Transcript_16557:38-964(-)
MKSDVDVEASPTWALDPEESPTTGTVDNTKIAGESSTEGKETSTFSADVEEGRNDEQMPLWVRENVDDDDDHKETTSYGSTSENKHVDSNTNNEADTAEPPRKPIMLRLFNIFETFGVITCLRLLVMQLAPLFLVPLNQFSWLQIALRLYVSLCCMVFAVVEMELPFPFIKEGKTFQSWISKGFLYLFIGLVGMEESYMVLVEDLQQQEKTHFRQKHQYDEVHVSSWAALAISGASLVMVVLGCLYVLFGLCCMRKWRDTLRHDYLEALQAYHERNNIPTGVDIKAKILEFFQSIWRSIKHKFDDIEI